MKANKTLRLFAKQHCFRLITIAFQTQRGGEVEFEGCVTIDDSERLSEILREIVVMCDRAEMLAAEKARQS